MSGGKALLEALKKENVSTIFGIPGGSTLPLYDELCQFDIRHILCAHEQSAAHMADGYARASGKTGVCLATSGPGATNLVTGIATAYIDSSPIVALTGQVARPMIGKDSFQETDIIGITTPITKHSFQPLHASEIPKVVKEAFYIAATGRPGPVLIDLPKDVQIETSEMTFPKEVKIRGYHPQIKISSDQIRNAVQLILKSKKPILLAGGGIHISKAYQELFELSNMLQAPVATSLMGKGVFPENHPLSLGLVGMHGSPEANRLVMDSDLVIAVAFRFSDRTTGNVEEFCLDSKMIHIDIDDAEIEKNRYVDIAVVGDAREILQEIMQQLLTSNKKERNDWVKRVVAVKESLKPFIEKHYDGFKPPAILRALREVLPDNAIVTTEVGQNQMWAALYFKVITPRSFISSGGLGTMGFGFPASLGVKVAVPDSVVVDIAGDGSFCMTSNSLATAVSEKIPVIILVLDNQRLGMVAQWQRLFYDRRCFAVHLQNPDFIKLARAYGADGMLVQDLTELRKAVKDAIKNDVPTVIDVPISPEEDVMPMVPPGEGLDSIMGVT